MKICSALLLLCLLISSAWAADIPALKKLYNENYNNFYQQRFCGRNVARFVSEANKRKINLSNSYVLKLAGAGFLETSGFYTRGNLDDRAMLGYFHMVFVADGYVFDFDLSDSLVLPINEYVRLQFTPPYDPFYVFGIEYKSKEQLKYWTVTRFEWADYIQSREVATWIKKMPEYVDLTKILMLPRL